MKKTIILLGVSITVLSACSQKPTIDRADYWQRQDVTSALYLQGPKAQQQLHIDIAGCTNDIKEVKRLEKIRKAIPANEANANAMQGWDTPARDGYLYSEHSDYHDFETCMRAKGWTRAAYLPFTEVDKANYEYIRGKKRERTPRERENVTSVHVQAQEKKQYNNLND